MVSAVDRQQSSRGFYLKSMADIIVSASMASMGVIWTPKPQEITLQGNWNILWGISLNVYSK